MKKSLVFSIVTMFASVASFVGCGKPADTPAPAPSATASEDEHGHSHGSHGAGPHDGAVADWGGGKYHVEFTVDHDKKEATVYVLGSDEKTPAPIKAQKLLLSIKQPAFQVELLPTPQAGEADAASKFVGAHDSLGVVQEFAGTISAEVDGTPYAGDFAEVAHGTHEHK